MLYFLLPNTHPNIYKSLVCKTTDNIPPPIALSHSFAKSLYDCKDKITTYEDQWDTFKKITNPYEYIHTVIPNKRFPVAKLRPLSRAYFKMVEMWHLFQFCAAPDPIRTFHLAEGPGSFIEAILELRKNSKDIYYGMTLLEDRCDKNIPTWRKIQHLMRENKNVIIENGADGTGNILSLANFDRCVELYHDSMDFITADGGFDFSMDFNNQEITIAELLFAQVAYAIAMQKQNGCFVLKLFDCFMAHTEDILCLLSSLYRECYITKPLTSRFANSEKYVVCKYFIGPTRVPDLLPVLRATLEQMLLVTKKKPMGGQHIHRFLDLSIPCYFSKKVEEYNGVFVQQQIENIHNTLLLIENKNRIARVDALIMCHVQKSITWCTKHRIAIGDSI